MLAAIFYFLAYTFVMKYIPGIKDDSGQVDVRLFIGCVGSLVGIVEGVFAGIRSRQLSAFFLSPLVCAAVTAMAWFTAAAIPWTQDAGGTPTSWGFVILAVAFSIITSVVIKLVEALVLRIKTSAEKIKATIDRAYQPNASRAIRDSEAPKKSSADESVDPFSPPDM
jgi:hypothetical protein